MNQFSQIWERNVEVPEAHRRCLHEVIATNTAKNPHKLAVHAWDGDLTYVELDSMASLLARNLIKLGAGSEVVVPLFFEKSLYTVVAVLGVLKAGGAFALVDASLPKARLQAIVDRCDAQVICTSSQNAQMCSDLASNVVVVSGQSLTQTSDIDGLLCISDPSIPLYVCFTSGSTGVPKGICHTHTSFYTTFKHQAHLLGFDENCRTFDFASYSFDVAVHNVLTTLAVGGCLCIPSDADRKSNLNESICEMRATIVNLTSTIAHLLRPEQLPHVQTLLLLGEAANQADLERLWGEFRIINTYGPAECTPISTINLNATSPAAAVGIGVGVGVLAWVTNPDNHDELAGYGDVGELLLEGHCLARGYIRDPEKTSQVFINDPEWLLRGTEQHPGRHGRLYKTGDLVRYNEDGTLHFIGRKDTQVKVRGHRIELGEVEAHLGKTLSSAIQIAVEVIEPESNRSKAMLAAFLSIPTSKEVSKLEELYTFKSSISSGLNVLQLRSDLLGSFQKTLPGYMIPSVFFEMESIPQTPSAKTDRKRLREIGSLLSFRDLAGAQSETFAERRQPVTSDQLQLHQAWAKVLSLHGDEIGLYDNLFKLGGDSVTAMKLVAEIRVAGFDLTVAEIFEHPKLLDMANALRRLETQSDLQPAITPFSILFGDDVASENAISKLRQDLANLCKLEPAIVEDAYPSSALQQGLLSITARKSGAYTLQAVLELSPNVNLSWFKRAWETTVDRLAILRTRIIHHQKFGALQTVLNDTLSWNQHTGSLQDYLDEDKKLPMGFGEALTRFCLVAEDGRHPKYFVWTVHHALYDGWTLDLILKGVKEAYYGLIDSSKPAINNNSNLETGYNHFVRHMVEQNQNTSAVESFWSSYCTDADLIVFPSLPSKTHEPKPDSSTEKYLKIQPKDDITMSTLLRAALSILLSQYTGSSDVVFGATLSGRNAHVANIDQIAGPTITTIPIRCQVQPDQSVDEFLEAQQKSATAMIPFEQASLQQISQISDECRLACRFQTLLVVQPAVNDFEDDELIGEWQTKSLKEFTNYAITIEALLQHDGLTFRAGYDSAVVTSLQMENMLGHLAEITRQLSMNKAGQVVKNVNAVTANDNNTLWKWNSELPTFIDSCVHDVIKSQADARPQAPAVCGWDGEFQYGELDRLATKLAKHLVHHGVGAEVIVPILFDRSIWVIVAMMAVMKAGGAFLPLNPSEAETRRNEILNQAKPILALVSPSHKDVSLLPGCSSWVVSAESVSSLDENQLDTVSLPVTSSSCPVYVIFTSGSTGQPKGVVLEHGAVATSCTHHGERFGFGHGTRMLQFSSYTFDASIIEILTTLISGGCVCVPSEKDRLGDLASAINTLNVNSTLLTPTVARTLRPAEIKTLTTLIFGGEAVYQSDYDQWADLPTLINAYGPTECAVTSVIRRYDRSKTKTGSIGTPVGCAAWVVDPSDHNQLRPIGGVGELLLEGHILARGYLNNKDKTDAAFIDDPVWLINGSNDGMNKGRRGRMYKTGDIVRYNEDGSVSYVGRKDAQVKIRGQRLELGEVETVLKTCLPEVTQIVAEAIVPGGIKSKTMLVAFLTTSTTGEAADGLRRVTQVAQGLQMVSFSNDMETRISEKLPRFMVPTMYLLMDGIPLMPSGKANRGALRSMAGAITPEQWTKFQSKANGVTKTPPRNSIESKLRDIWAVVLNIEAESLGVDDSFFHVGGDSITAMQLSSAIRSAMGDISTSDILQKKTIAKLALILDKVESSLKTKPAAQTSHAQTHLEHEFALSPIQQLYTLVEPEPTKCFDQYFFLRTQTQLSLSQLRSAMRAVVARHPMLRARFKQDGTGQWLQRITNDASGSLHVCELAGTKGEEISRQEISRAIAHDRAMLDIENGPLTVAMLLEYNGSQHVFFAIHHLVVDLVSWRILLQEVEEHIRQGTIRSPLPQVDFEKWSTLQRAHVRKSLKQDRGKMPSLPTPPLTPPGAPMLAYWDMSMTNNTEGATLTKSFILGEQATAAIMGKCNDAFATRPVELMISALAYAFIKAFPDREVPVIHTEGHGREPWNDALDVSRTVGWFTTMFPIKAKLIPATAMPETVQRIKDSVRTLPRNGWECFTQKFADLEEAQNSLNEYPVEVLFNYAGAYQQLERSDSLFQSAMLPTGCEPKSWNDLNRFCLFDVFCQSDQGCLSASMTYPRHSNHQDKITAWLGHFEDALSTISVEFASLPSSLTLADFPMAFKSYDDLDTFQNTLVSELGISNVKQIEDVYPCSPMQQGILVAQGKDFDNYRTVLSIEVKSKGHHQHIDVAKIHSAWKEVIQKHPMLRTILIDNIPGAESTMQMVLKNPEPSVSILTLEQWEAQREKTTVNYAANEPQHHLSIVTISSQRVNLELEINHVIADGYSVYNILLQDLELAYEDSLESTEPLYSEFIKYLSSQSKEADTAFWLNYLKGAEPCFVSNAISSCGKNEPEAFTMSLNDLNVAQMRHFTSTHEITTATLFQAAWAMVLRLFTGQNSPSFGILTSGRNIPVSHVADIFGPLINIVPCHVRLEDDITIFETLQRTQQEYIESLPHQTLSLIDIHRGLGVGATGLFNSIISFQRNTEKSDEKTPDGRIDMRYVEVRDQVEFDVSVAVDDNFVGNDDDPINVELLFKAGFTTKSQAQLLADVFSRIIGAIVNSTADSTQNNLGLLRDDDIKELTAWNCNQALPCVDDCIHKLIEQQAQKQPHAQAVASWDGNLTYRELDDLACRLASHLTQLGVGPEVVVPLSFEKSKWTVVSWLACLKAGGGFILLDPSLPDARVANICRIVKAKIAIGSKSHSRRFADIVETVITMDQRNMDSLLEALPYSCNVSPENAAYIIFTSGSTGEPKGAIITHRAYSTAAMHHGPVMDMSPNTRSLQFGSYNFAGAIMEMLMVLIHGGCTCILSDEQRGPGPKLCKAIAELNANWAFLTSTVLAYMAPDDVPSLKTICVGGEAVRSSQIKQWATKVHQRQTYGSAETSAVVSSAKLDPSSANTDVGRPTTGCYWIVNPKNTDQLMPPGLPGEIIIEGAVIAREYMGNTEKTASTFISQPAWRSSFGPANKKASFYRTGDLGCFREDGRIELLGRKDTQVKLRGQRIETGEVEYQARNASSDVKEAAVELATIGSNTGTELVGFLVMDDPENTEKTSCVVQTVRASLEKTLPYFMVPALLVPITKLPLTVSGKTDRRRLRISVSELSDEDLSRLAALAKSKARQPQTEHEVLMQSMWAEALNLETSAIGLDDSFFRLGGDSVAAMKLVGIARKHQVTLTVADIFRQPSLAAQAESLAKVPSSESLESHLVEPFSLLSITDSTVEDLRNSLSKNVDDLQPHEIQDAYPCTPLQKALLSSTASDDDGDYMLQLTLDMSSDVNEEELKQAWELVIASTPILRTRVFHHSAFGLIQAVCDRSEAWVTIDGEIDAYLETDRAQKMNLGDKLLRLASVTDSDKKWMVCTIHHALYDALSLPDVLEVVGQVYMGGQLAIRTPFNAFIEHLNAINETDSEDYWRSYLSGGQFTTFPTLPLSITSPSANCAVEKDIMVTVNDTSFTSSTLVRAALAMVISQYTGSSDVVFGALVSGRNAPIAGIEEIVGPTIATVPVRVHIPLHETVQDYMESIQTAATDMFEYEQIGLQKISKNSEQGRDACGFQTLLEVQPSGLSTIDQNNGVGTWVPVSDPKGFTSHALTLDCIVHEADAGQYKITLKATVDVEVLDKDTTKNMLAHLGTTIQRLAVAEPNQKLDEIEMLSDTDKDQMWKWNDINLQPSHDCLQNLIRDRVQESPDAPAVCAWDGELTYEELDEVSSRLAYQLMAFGIGPESIVPLFFEKSMYTVIAVLGVLKAGGAFALLDMSLPIGRLHSAIEQCKAKVVCSSQKNKELCSVPGTDIRVVSADSINEWPQLGSRSKQILPYYSPDSPMYVCFTSGSTGMPKGIVLTHSAFASALNQQAKLLGFNRNSRVFDFASYSFDVAVHNVMTTLAVGGCLCIPSDADRKNNVNGSLTAFKANLVNVTATVSRLLKPELLPHLQTLLFLGEAVGTKDLERLWEMENLSRIVNTYGPAECTPISTINLTATCPSEAAGIGSGVGVATWIVDPDDSSKLVPLGTVGELLLEGPTLARGYLGDPEKTDKAFIQAPEWLKAGNGSYSGRSGRLYKTGDLAKYNADGSLAFIGRKDTQIKLHGQRLELGEIEHHIQGCILNPGEVQVVADVITPGGDKERPILAVFIVHQDEECDDSSTRGSTSGSMSGNSSSNASYLFDSISSISDTLEVVTLNPEINLELSKRLPTYMTPSVYLKVPVLPQTPSGKTDRKFLRELGSGMSPERLAALRNTTNVPKRLPQTATAKSLAEIWSNILKIDTSAVGLDDNFFLLGGDSVAAMQLVAEARDADIDLTVAEIFQMPVLMTLAEHVSTNKRPLASGTIPRFSLINTADNIEEMQKDLGILLNVRAELIEDAYPCTPLQEGLMSLTIKDSDAYVMNAVLDIDPQIRIDSLKYAWQQVIQTTQILRTRIVQHDQLGLLQVVTNNEILWYEASSVEAYSLQLQQESMGLGVPLCRFAIIPGQGYEPRKLVWSMHHAVYDGASLPLLLSRLNNAYRTHVTGHATQQEDASSFNVFVNYIIQKDIQDANEFWKTYLNDNESVPFPASKHTGLDVSPNQIEREVTFETSSNSAITMSSVIRGALGILISQHTCNQDVTFGAVVSGRSAPVHGIEYIAGPTIAAVPVRIQMKREESVMLYLDRIQQQATQMIDYEQTGLQNIAKISNDTKDACEFQTLLVVQPEDAELQAEESQMGSWNLISDSSAFNSYPLMIECSLSRRGASMKLKMTFDANTISSVKMEHFTEQFCFILRQLMAVDSSTRLSNIQGVTEKDAEVFWKLNGNIPAPVSTCLPDMFTKQAKSQPNAPAIHGHDGRYSYKELDENSSHLAKRLIEVGASPGSLVAICYEKSVFPIFSMLACNKAGCAFVPFNPADDSERHQYLLKETNARVVITSEQTHARFQSLEASLGIRSLLVSSDSLAELALTQELPVASELPSLGPDFLMYTLFTSGSSGTPKGVMLNHQSVVTSLISHGTRFGFDKSSRVLQFSSYTFDACITEIYGTLIHGGCVCVPSEQSRLSDLEGAIRHLNTNIAMITPTVSHMLEPAKVPSLHTLILCGEASTFKDYIKWQTLPKLINGYGPTEASIFAVTATYQQIKDSPGCIGNAVGCVSWIVDPKDHTRLTPFGGIGELVLEGETVADGYLNDLKKTETAFISCPQWLQQRHDGQPGRQSRLYKTGDLVYYNDDGTLSFVARCDNQVKLRGQRLELGEVEANVRACLPSAQQVAAEVIMPGNEKSKATLAVFLPSTVELENDPSLSFGSQSIDIDGTTLVQAQIGSEIHSALARKMPSYMVPSVYFKLDNVPLSASGKADRKRLRHIGSRLTAQQLVSMKATAAEGSKCKPENEKQVLLLGLWARVLDISEETIGLDDSFFRLGGDSIAAMKVVGLLRATSMTLTVAAIFQNPTLRSQAEAMAGGSHSGENIESFSLLGDISVAEVSQLCSIDTEFIVDAYRCTSLQEGLLSMTAYGKGTYMLQATLKLSPETNMALLQHAWDEVIRETAILRTRIVQHDQLGLIQVVHNQALEWNKAEHLEEYLEADHDSPMGLGDALCRLTLIQPQDDTTPTHLVWTIHHAIYDGWSLSIVLKNLMNTYQGIHVSRPAAEFNSFVKYIDDHREEARAYWQEYLDSCDAIEFPRRSGSLQKPIHRKFETELPLPLKTNTDATISTVVRAALAMAINQNTGSSDIVFGATVSGRVAPVSGISDIVGPTIATVPIRIHLLESQTIGEYLTQVQSEATRMEKTAFEQMGLQNISKLSDSCQKACKFQTLLVVQPEENDFSDDSILGTWISSSDEGALEAFSTYPLTIECMLSAAAVKFRCTFDASIIQSWLVDLLLSRFLDSLLQLLTTDPETKLGDLNVMSDKELSMMWNWNSSVPELYNVSLDSLVQQQVQERPNAPAVCSWDGDFTYKELDVMSRRLAIFLHQRDISAEAVVAIAFEKTKWVAVAMLAVLRAGGTFVALGGSQASERNMHILEETKSPMVLVSPSFADTDVPEGCEKFILSQDSMNELEYLHDQSVGFSKSHPDFAAYIIFTSGSTGKPKGVVLPHKSIATSCKHHGQRFGFGPETRILQFSSFTFDASIVEIFTTLVFGGCVCIPSDADRLGNLANAVTTLRVNTLQTTPTVARTLNAEDLPTVTSITFCGEPVSQADFLEWQHLPCIMNGYGPTEAAICSTIEIYDGGMTQPDSIGRGVGCVTWVVDENDENKLAAIGTIGELLIEGNVLARGYLNDEEKTAASFISAPDWLRQGHSSHNGRDGRLYKTGDLVRYYEDGRLLYVGRKDTQAKIRGQRLELSEIEHHVQLCVGSIGQVVAEVVQPGGQKDKEILAIFLTQGNEKVHGEIQKLFNEPTHIQPGLQLLMAPPDLGATLSQNLPAYMIPSMYLLLDSIPLMPSGKSNRKALRELIANIDPQRLNQLMASNARQLKKRQPVEETEMALQGLWSRVLQVHVDDIGLDDSFFRLGGGSITAMRLVGVAREVGVVLAVSDIFKYPTLETQSKLLNLTLGTSIPAVEPAQPFEVAMIDNSQDSVRFVQEAVAPLQLRDAYLATHFQIDTITHAMELPEEAFNYFYFNMGHNVQVKSLVSSCNAAVERFDMLRATFVQVAGKLWHATLSEIPVDVELVQTDKTLSSSFDKLCVADGRRCFSLGQPLTSFKLIHNEQEGYRFVIRLSHAQYDGVSFPIMVENLMNMYQGKKAEPFIEYATYLKYARTRKQELLQHWSERLHSAQPSQLPCLSDSEDSSQQSLKVQIERSVTINSSGMPEGITLASVTSAAWAVVLSVLLGRQDVIYGTLVTGRNSKFANVERVVGPCGNIVPVRVQLERHTTARDLFADVQDQQTMIGEADSLGWQDIVQSCANWSESMRLDSFVKFQGIDENYEFNVNDEVVSTGYFDKQKYAPRGYVGILTYPTMDGVKVRVSSSILTTSVANAEWLASSMCRTMAILLENQTEPLDTCIGKVSEALSESKP